MKIWVLDTKTPTYRLVRLNFENRDNYKYLGEFNDESLAKYFLELQNDIDVEKNLKLLKYYGYLHLFIISK
nr:hypothetical protein [uncultured Sulfurimonas sp.]